MTDWGHTVVEILGVTVPIIIYMAANRYTAKKDTEARHEQNQLKLNEIIAERNYLPPHGHIEEDGPLKADGIIRKPNGRH